MGLIVEFECPRCGDSEKVQDGGGFIGRVKTMVCRDCQELVSVTVWVQPGREEEAERVEKAAREYLQHLQAMGKELPCEHANVRPWNSWWRRCPKCRARMSKGKVVGAWD